MARRRMSLPQLIPNLLTITAICAGLTAILLAFEGRFQPAVGLIVLAAVLDALDGRLARLFKSESAIGAELDSLADFLNFGVAPALLMYVWLLHEAGGPGWIAVLIYAVCCVLRLARFNVDARAETEAARDDADDGSQADEPPVDRKHFTGVPSPAGGLLAMLPLFLSKVLPEALQPHAVLAGIYMALIGLLMISRIPTASLKSVTVATENVRYLVVALVAVAAALVSWPWATLALLDLAYLAGIVVTWRGRRRAR